MVMLLGFHSSRPHGGDKLRRSKGLHQGVSLGGAWSSIFEYAYAYTFAIICIMMQLCIYIYVMQCNVM